MKKLFIGSTLTILSCCALAFETPTMGWSSWNTYSTGISDSLIMKQADAMVSTGLAKAGYKYINIDDGYQGGRDEKTGELKINPYRFPNGLKPVVDHIHSLGLKAGIYSDAGENTCGNYWVNDTLSRNVGLLGHEEQDCRLFFNDLGFDFIKVDFCGAHIPASHKRYWFDTQDRYGAIRKAMDATGRKNLRLNMCRWAYPGTWVYDVATSWRTTVDIDCSWLRVYEIIHENLYMSAFARPGHYNDMDMLEVGRTLSQTEDETHMAMWCMLASPLLIGCDMTTLRPESYDLLTNEYLIAINQDPLGKQAHVQKADNRGGYILVKDLKEAHGTERAVAFYNSTDNEIELSISLEELELVGPAKAIDALRKKKIRDIKSDIKVKLAPHATEVYILKAKDRLMRTSYEAETAFLTAYQELYDPTFVGTPYLLYDERLSGGVGIINAGVTPNNDIVWEDVMIPETGFYDIVIHYLPMNIPRTFAKSKVWVPAISCADMTPEFYLSIDGGQGYEIIPNTESDAVETEIIRLCIPEGQHKIRLYGHNIMPVIDRITINKVEN